MLLISHAAALFSIIYIYIYTYILKKPFSKGNIHHYIAYRDQQVLHSLCCYHALSSPNQLIYTTTVFLLQIEGKI